MAERDLQFVQKVVDYYNFNRSTVRKTAAHFGIGKSTVYSYITEAMPNKLSLEILNLNKSESHIRGGQATKNKYQSMRS